jgi:membrane-associated phospholipid phosphatase
MTAANDLHRDDGTLTPLRRCAANVVAALAVVAGPAKIPPRPIAASLRPLAIRVAISFVVFSLLMLLIDAPVMRAVGRLPRWIIAPFDEITDFGKSGWFLWPLGLLFIALAALPARLGRVSQAVLAAVMVRIGFLFLAIGVPGLFVTTVKRMIGRARPMVGGHLDPFLFSPFKWTAAYASLPSGHATTAFSVLVAFGSLFPRWRTEILIYTGLIALSRMVVNAHYPSDVFAGALVGIVGALMVRRYFALRRLGFSIGPDGALHQYPGPSLKRIKAVARELLGS